MPDHYRANWKNAERVIEMWKDVGKMVVDYLNDADIHEPNEQILEAIYRLAPELRR